MADVLAKLREYVDTMGVTRATLLEFATACFEGGQSQMGYAVLKHATDVLNANPACNDAQVLYEAYRRTLLCKVHADVYGTAHMVPPTDAMAMQMVESLHMMRSAEAAGSTVHQQASLIPS